MLSTLKSGEQSIEGFLCSFLCSTTNASSSSEEPPSNPSSEEKFSLSEKSSIRLLNPKISSSKFSLSFGILILVEIYKIWGWDFYFWSSIGF